MQGSSFFCLFCVLNLFIRFVIINKKEYSHKVSSLPRKVQTVKRESGENPERLEPPYASKACAKDESQSLGNREGGHKAFENSYVMQAGRPALISSCKMRNAQRGDVFDAVRIRTFYFCVRLRASQKNSAVVISYYRGFFI